MPETIVDLLDEEQIRQMCCGRGPSSAEQPACSSGSLEYELHNMHNFEGGRKAERNLRQQDSPLRHRNYSAETVDKPIKVFFSCEIHKTFTAVSQM